MSFDLCSHGEAFSGCTWRSTAPPRTALQVVIGETTDIGKPRLPCGAKSMRSKFLHREFK